MVKASSLPVEKGTSTPHSSPKLLSAHDGLEPIHKSTRQSSATPSPPPNAPRVDFSTLRSTPLAPRRRFAPTPIKVAEFVKTPAKTKTRTKTLDKTLLRSEHVFGISRAEMVDGVELSLQQLAISDPISDSGSPVHSLQGQDDSEPSQSPQFQDDVQHFEESSQIVHRQPELSSTISTPLRKAPSLSDLFHDDSPIPSPNTQDESFHSARSIVSSRRSLELDAHEIHSGPSSPNLIKPSIIDIGSDVDSPPKPYIDLTVSGDDEAESDQEGDSTDEGEHGNGEEQEYDGEEEEYDVTKHYDDSLGSLRDFIVDDDDEDEYDEEDGEDGDEELESEDEWRRKKDDNRRKRLVDPFRGRSRLGSGENIASSGYDGEVITSDDIGEEDEDEVDDDLEVRKTNHPGVSQDRDRLVFPDLEKLLLISDSESEASSSPSVPIYRPKKSASKREYASAKTLGRRWEAARVKIALEVFRDLDERVFGSQLGPEGFNAKIEWCKRLLTTAGTASFSRKILPNGEKAVVATIKMSVKVCTGEEQILSTMAHEMCHLATWLISDERKNPHGRIFKSWGQKVMRVRKDIQVTTKHSYQIEYKYQWQCVNTKCGHIYKRHSKSIDIQKSHCRICHSTLEPLFVTKSATPFQEYLKNNLVYAKAAMKGVKHGEVMRALSKRWTEVGSATIQEHQEYWKSLARLSNAAAL
ncbi:SprT-like family-domain-containing protein [Naematelia encephala]|uniref:SprT-like family-domain-containing protein n=1 Tax=Naematelia encephala TaxID=71784 RepID=A0A1Y2AGQ6_9TREE|nr:SprT-like family-domain-containing protein [Naematelia encephala]